MNIIVNGDLTLLYFTLGHVRLIPRFRLLGCLKNVALVFVYGCLEDFLFHLTQHPFLIDGLNDVRQESLQGHSPCQPGMTLQVSDEKHAI